MKRRQVFRAQASKSQTGSSSRRFTNSGPVLPFNPSSIAGCQLWLDAADTSSILLSGSSNVSLWIDKSGNERHATVYNGTPTYSLASGVTFNGSSSLQVSYTASPTVETLFVIIKFNSVSSQSDIFAGTSTGQREFLMYSPYSPGTLYLGQYGSAPSGSINGGTVTTGTTYMLEYVFNGTGNSISFFQSGNTIISGTPQFTYGSGGTTSLIGSYGGGGFLQGQIYDIIVFNNALSTIQRQKVEGYLASKWGLQTSLPFNHPYKSIAPTYEEPVFVPTLILGNQLWLDGEDTSSMTLSGSSVTAWADKSGNNRNTTNSVFSSPTLQNQTVTFTGTNGLRFSTTFPSFYDIFAVAAPLSSTDSWRTLLQVAEGTASHIVLVEAGTTRLGSWYGGFRQFGSLTWSGTKSLLFARLNSNLTMNAALNGTETLTSDTDAVGAASSATINLGNAVGSGQPWGDLNEFLLFNPPLTLQQRKRVEGYLAQKWGLHSFLPANHPYKTIAPTGIPRSITIQSLSALFNPATNTALSIPSKSSFTLGTNNHTIEFWFYQTNRTTYDITFSYGDNPPVWTGTSTYIFQAGNPHSTCILGNGAGGWAVELFKGGNSYALNTWHHFAIVRNGTTFTLYIDGTSHSTATSSVSIGPSVGSMVIGSLTSTGHVDGFTGYISNFRFVNGTAVYTSNFTPPTSPLTAIPNTQVLIQGLVDRSPNVYTVTNYGSVALSTTISPFV
jgi:hypothetical protein